MWVNIPSDLKSEFKAECARNGDSMIGAIIRLIQFYITKKGKIK